MAEQLATFLRQLHAIPNDALAQYFWLESDRKRTREDWAARLSDIQRDIYPYLWADQKHWVAELFAPVLDGTLDMQNYDPVLIHDDLASYHILFDPAMKCINGVIDFGVAKLMGQYAVMEDDLAEIKSWLIGGLMPVGPGEIRVAYSQATQAVAGADPKVRRFALGYVHNLSKRTAVYTTYAHTRGTNGASAANGGATGVGGKSNVIDLGVRHSF